MYRTTGTLRISAIETTVENSQEDSDDEVQIISVGGKTADLLPKRTKLPKAEELKPWVPSGKGNSWVEVDQDETDEEAKADGDNSSDSEVEVVKEITMKDRIVDNIDLDGDSEEEATVTLKSSDVTNA
uniref:Uncharacterized protein n=1 Tax=Graphocephala atropunctata TaxID=36148 RepID=A0A1B6KJD0_9HEMI